MKKTVTILIILLLSIANITAQVAINDNGASADNSAMLDISSSDKGVLIPRLTDTQKNNISNPANGLLIYNSTNKYFEYYDNNVWNILKPAQNVSFVIDGDYDTKIQVEENNDEDKIRFDLGGTEYFVMTNGRLEVSNTGQSVFLGEGAGNKDDLSYNQNVFIGYNTAYNTTTGNHNVAVGESSMFTNESGYDNTALGYQSLYDLETGMDNVAVGAYSLKTNMASGNTAVGTASLFYNGTGANNVALGSKAMYANQSGSNNIAIGYKAAHNNTTPISNIAIGQHSLFENTRSHIVAVGDSALYKNGSGATESYQGQYNTAIGSKALFDNTLGYSNTGVGFNSLINNDEGWKNTALGAFAMRYNNSGSRNTAIGNEALNNNDAGSYNTAVGHQALSANNENYNTAIGAESMINNSNGSLNTSTGFKSMYSNIGGSENTAFGAYTLHYNVASNNTAFGNVALFNNSEGSGNVAVGMYALYNNATGSHNTAIGYEADVLDNNFTNATAIGYDAKAGMNDAVVIGNSSVNVGLAGVSAPSEKLEVPGAVKIGDTDNPSPSAGTIRWNEVSGNFEGYDGNDWISLSGITNGWGYNSSDIYGDETLDYDSTDVWEYGYSIHSDGDFVAIGAPGADSDKGKVFVFEKSSGGWLLDQILTASDGSTGDRYGSSVSVKHHMLYPVGVHIVVGAPGANSGKGKAYIHKFWTSGWTESNILSPTDLTTNANFGSSVSVEFGFVAVGANGFNGNRGKVYMYDQDSNYDYVFHSALIPGDIGVGDNFGYSLSHDDNWLIVGAPGDYSNSVTGKAYLYENQSSTWTQVSKFTNNLVDEFGYSVSIIMDNDENIAIGAPRADGSTFYEEGKVFVYEKSGSTWSLTGTLINPSPSNYFMMGSSVSTTYGNNVLVGVPYSGSGDNGYALLYEKVNGSWIMTNKFYPSSMSEKFMGSTVNMLSPTEAFVYSKKANGKGKVYNFMTKPNY